ncbi:hypothetical protein HY285_05680 [Candidatus Peregrinibacteria bacterium]|nr:hypothetical protein [Candidatus Peregrinibacteria bacterium]MBI3816997.1 hypothetical protein [Candidatus Peregrinibacteria bacterium]
MAQPQTAAPQPPKIPASGKELYNELMGKIEPELTTDQIPLLPEKYKNETPDQAAVRAERYNKAYAAYEAAYAAYMQQLAGEVSSYRRSAFGSVEAKDRQKETAALDELESLITTPTP